MTDDKMRRGDGTEKEERERETAREQGEIRQPSNRQRVRRTLTVQQMIKNARDCQSQELC